MQKTILRLLSPLLLIPVLLSCTKEQSGFSDLPVIKSYLVPGNHIRVKISYKLPYEESVTSYAGDISKLDVTILAGGIGYRLIPQGDGVYEDTLGLITVLPDSAYELSLVYNGLPVSSATTIPARPSGVTQSDTAITLAQIDPDNPPAPGQQTTVDIAWSNREGDYYLLTVECLEQDPVPIIKDSIPSSDIFSTQPVTDSTYEIRSMMFRYFGRNRIILYHINPEYSAFFMRQASTSQSYEEPPSNITNGLGIFTGINADTLFLKINME
jgi:hypothetical protein